VIFSAEAGGDSSVTTGLWRFKMNYFQNNILWKSYFQRRKLCPQVTYLICTTTTTTAGAYLKIIKNKLLNNFW
jgi:hypothetical protein